MHTIQIIAESHVDHGLTKEQLEYALATVAEIAESGRLIIETVVLPEGYGEAPCSLRGPAVGDPPIGESDVYYAKRGERAGESRLTSRLLPRATRSVTVIAGPHRDHALVLYTAFGGPHTPREPWDPSLDDAGREESRAFWAQHALATGGE